MKKDPRIFIDHILECIELVEDYLHGKTAEDFMGSTQLQDAVIRRIEIIGEATKNLPQDFNVLFHFSAGGRGEPFNHFRKVTPPDSQTVVRTNKDTLYSMSIVDTEKGATITVPETPKGRKRCSQVLRYKMHCAADSET